MQEEGPFVSIAAICFKAGITTAPGRKVPDVMILESIHNSVVVHDRVGQRGQLPERKLVFRLVGGHRAAAKVEVRHVAPNGAERTLSTATATMGDTWMPPPLRVDVQNIGEHWFDLYVDGRRVARVPYAIVRFDDSMKAQ